MPIQALEELDIRGKLPDTQLTDNYLRDRDSAKQFFEAEVQQKWWDALKHWQGKHLKTPIKGRSKLFIRKPRAISARIQAGLLDAFFANPDELISVTPGRKTVQQPIVDPATGEPAIDPNTGQPAVQQVPSPDVAAARIRQAYLNYRLTKTIPWFQLVHSASDDLSVFNVAVFAIDWVKRIEKYEITEEETMVDPMTGQPMIDQMTGQPQMRQMPPRTEELILQNEPRVRLIVPEYIRVDPRVDWINPFDGQFFIHDDFTYFQELAQLAEGDPLIDMDNVSASPSVSRSNGPQGVIDQQRRNFSWEQFEDPDRKEILVGRYFYKVAGKWWIAWLDGDGRILKRPDMVREALGKPGYVIGVLEPESHVLYGDSKLTQLQDYFIFKNTWRNMRLDNAARIMNRHTIVSNDANADLVSLANKRPGGITTVDGDVRAAIAQEEISDISSSGYNEETMVDRDLEESSVTDISQGLTPQTKELATQTVAREQHANIKEAVAIRIVAETLIRPAAEMILALAEDHESDESIMQIAGEMAGIVMPDDNIPSLADIKGQYQVKVRAGLGTVNRATKLQNFDAGFQRIVGTYGPVAGIPMVRDLLNQLGVTNVDEVLEYIKQSFLLQTRTQTEERKTNQQSKNGKSPEGGGNGKGRMTNDIEESRKTARQ